MPGTQTNSHLSSYYRDEPQSHLVPQQGAQHHKASSMNAVCKPATALRKQGRHINQLKWKTILWMCTLKVIKDSSSYLYAIRKIIIMISISNCLKI